MRAVSVVVVLLGLLLGASSARAQIVPFAIGNVKVTPDGGPALGPVATSATNVLATFQVKNNFDTAQEYDLTCTRTGRVSSCYIDVESISLDPYETVAVNVYFNTSSTAGSGTLTLRADGIAWDTGYHNVSVVVPTAPAVALLQHSDSTWDRSHCLVLWAGAAAWQCGDLVLGHALPGYATLGKERTLGLVYSSAQGTPRPAIAARVSAPSVTMGLSAIWVGLKVNGTWRDSARYTAWTSGARQVVLAFDATPLATGAYPFQLEVRAVYGGGTYATTRSGTLAVVNRATSPYGQGWHLTGVEQLVFNQPAGTGAGILRVTSEGSALLYAPDPQDGDRWIAPAGAFRDTIVNVGDTGWVRTLRHGVQVGYDLQGRHHWTRNRAGFTTRFTWVAGRLTSVVVPPVDSTATTYTLSYNGGGQLTGITDPAGRTLGAMVTGGRLVALTDPDSVGVAFAYDAAGRLIRRTDRRGYGTRFAYGKGLRVTEIRVPVGTGADSAVTTYAAWDEYGLATGYLGQVAVDTATVRTRYFGPRQGVADDATFVVDRWGAPTRITDPLGAVTRIERNDAARPALVTKVTAPNGRETRLTWNTRGNLTEERVVTTGLPDAQPDLVTTYAYADPDAPDAPSSVVAPGNVVTAYRYTTWGVPDSIIAPNGHLTEFTYRTSGPLANLLREVRERNVMAWDSVQQKAVLQSALSHRFGMNALGNVVADTSPMGRVRVRGYDAAQRVTDTWDPAGHHVSYVLDPLNRVRQVREHLEEVSGSGYGSPLVTEYLYGTDLLDTIYDPRDVRRTYRYDAAGRLVAEGDEAGVEEVYTLDHGGMLTSTATRASTVIDRTWDAAGRLTKLVWSASPGLVAGDSVTYSYDVMNQLLRAQSSSEAVARSYSALGQVTVDSGAVIATIGYDSAGRREWYRLGPAGLSSRDSIVYRYAPASGELQTLAVRWFGQSQLGDSVRFAWDPLGRRDSLLYSTGAIVRFAYDRDGIQRLVCGRHSGNANPNVFQFARVVAAVDQDGMPTSVVTSEESVPGCGGQHFYSPDLDQLNSYDARHYLVDQLLGNQNYEFQYDASGNRTYAAIPGKTRVMTYPAASNRVHEMTEAPIVATVEYGYEWGDGSRGSEYRCTVGADCYTQRAYRYDGLGRAVHDGTSSCEYDPLGRALAACAPGGPLLAYDGDNVLRTNPQAASGHWTFVHGPGIDDPLFGRLYQGGGAGVTYTYVTDGRGGQLAVGDWDGYNAIGTATFITGGQYSGVAYQAGTYGVQRMPSDSQVGLVHFRNRFYDEQTGQWTQEDPLGVSGGINLYQYNGNNPAQYSDPFGLCPKRMREDEEACKEWNKEQVALAIKFIEQERKLGNVHGLAVTYEIIGVNQDQVRPTCRQALEALRQKGNCSDYAFSHDPSNVMYLSADEGIPAMAFLIVHEEQHRIGLRISPASREATDRCAWFRQVLFVEGIHDGAMRSEAQRHPYYRANYSPIEHACGFTR